MADYTFNSNSNSQPDTSPSDKREAARIWNVFESKIILDELSLRESPNKNNKNTKIEDAASSEFPFIKINDYFLQKEEISSIRIDTTGKTPTIILTATFHNDLFISKNMPLDGDIISVMIQSRSDLLKPIRNDYVITSIKSTKKSTDAGNAIYMTFFGMLFLPGWQSYLGDESYRGTSMTTLKKVAEEIGLGFNTNENDTDDYQIWISSDTPELFVDEVCERSWKDENSFFDWWIDVYYNLNFVNIQKQLLSAETKVDNAAIISNVPSDFWWGNNNSKTVGTAKVFSNYKGYKTSSFYIKSWRPINNASEITFDYGTASFCTFYEHNNVLYNDQEAQKYWELEIPPNYDQDKLKNHIILRGRTKWDEKTGNSTPARANYSYNDIYKRASWLGIQYTLSNPDDDNTKWTGNHHRNYMRARVHNTINKVELDKLNVEVEVQGVNLNVIKGDKVPIALIRNNLINTLMVQPDFKQGEMLDLFYSGWYYVKGFSLSWIPGGEDEILNNFSQSFILSRREWPTPIPIEARNT